MRQVCQAQRTPKLDRVKLIDQRSDVTIDNKHVESPQTLLHHVECRVSRKGVCPHVSPKPPAPISMSRWRVPRVHCRVYGVAESGEAQVMSKFSVWDARAA
jgi:hypothetical protein